MALPDLQAASSTPTGHPLCTQRGWNQRSQEEGHSKEGKLEVGRVATLSVVLQFTELQWCLFFKCQKIRRTWKKKKRKGKVSFYCPPQLHLQTLWEELMASQGRSEIRTKYETTKIWKAQQVWTIDQKLSFGPSSAATSCVTLGKSLPCFVPHSKSVFCCLCVLFCGLFSFRKIRKCNLYPMSCLCTLLGNTQVLFYFYQNSQQLPDKGFCWPWIQLALPTKMRNKITSRRKQLNSSPISSVLHCHVQRSVTQH